mgnify:CR=1 FL=1
MNSQERILAALNRRPVDRTPVWFMRQAGRHLPEYRKLAAEHSFWERCQDLDLCTTITMQPIHRYRSIDAAIVFSDILTPLPALGYEVEYGGGIRIDPFVFDDVDDWTRFSARQHAPWAGDALKAIGDERKDIARLGFAGCPWTTSLYLLAGGTGDKEFQNTRSMIFSNLDETQHVLMTIAEAVGDLLADQVNHGGADAVQLFDTWAGLLSLEDYHEIALPATRRAIEVFRERSKRNVPLIHYAKGSAHLHEAIRTLDIEALSLDWRDDLKTNRASYGDRFAFQGNLDPSRMHGTPEAATVAARRVLSDAGDDPGHIFNLGHGFAPGARIDCVEAVLRLVTGEDA